MCVLGIVWEDINTRNFILKIMLKVGTACHTGSSCTLTLVHTYAHTGNVKMPGY